MKSLTSLALEKKIEVVETRIERIKKTIEAIKHNNKILFNRRGTLKTWEINKLHKLKAEICILNQELERKTIKLNEMMKIVPDKLSIGHINGIRHLEQMK